VIIVTGANGPYGRHVVEHLLARLPAGELAVTVREPGRAAGLAERGVQVRHGDFDRPETLAFHGAETILINATNYGTEPAVRARQQANALAAAQAAGVGRIVVTSWQDLDRCPLEMAGDFPLTEKLVAGTEAEWTLLRMTYGMAASLARDVRSALATGTLTAPAADAHATPAAVTDLAEATANILVETGHGRQTYELTGPDAITWADLALLATTLADRQITYRSVPDAEFAAQSQAAGFPPAGIDMLLAYYAAFRAGWAAIPDLTLTRLLHRPATASIEAVRHAMR
jgi:NAD(P)H dehydrogenase (quinone)